MDGRDLERDRPWELVHFRREFKYRWLGIKGDLRDIAVLEPLAIGIGAGALIYDWYDWVCEYLRYAIKSSESEHLRSLGESCPRVMQTFLGAWSTFVLKDAPERPQMNDQSRSDRDLRAALQKTIRTFLDGPLSELAREYGPNSAWSFSHNRRSWEHRAKSRGGDALLAWCATGITRWNPTEASWRSLAEQLMGLPQPQCVHQDMSAQHWFYDGEVWFSNMFYAPDQARLLIWEHKEKERQKFERLARQSVAAESAPTARRQRIPDDVRSFVWHRDGGKCVQCGSTVDLEYDHIVPVSKGGSSTERNVQLLCVACNRRKSDHI